MEMFGRKLTLEQFKGFVIANSLDEQILMPVSWALELIEQAQESEKLKERLQIGPQGDDKIDELEQSIEILRFQLIDENNKVDNLKRNLSRMLNNLGR